MDRDTSGADEAGIFAPGEHDIILRYCVVEQSAKVKHLLRTLPPGTAADELHRLHTDLLNSHLNFSPPSVDHHTAQAYELSSPHFDARGVAALPLGLGGHGFTLSVTPHHPHPPPTSPPPTLTRRTSLLLTTMGLFMPHGRPLRAS